MEPSEKIPGFEKEMKEIFGFDRREYIRQNRCVPPPIGCGEPVGLLRDEVSEKEYRMSGLCQKCQDLYFGGTEDD